MPGPPGRQPRSGTAPRSPQTRRRRRSFFSGSRSRLQTPLILGALLVPALVFLGRGHETLPEAVLNPSATVSPSDWRAMSNVGATSVSRVPVDGAPQGLTTAIEVSRTGDGGKWSLALASLRDPKDFFRVGRSYRMEVYVRDVLASAQPVGILLANANFGHRPTEASRYDRFGDASWHLLQRTFVATAPADVDTALYIALPVTGSMRWQFTLASVREVALPKPEEREAEADRVLDFAGAADTPPDASMWNHEVGGHGWGDDELQTYTESTSNASLDGQGHLTLTARRETATGPDRIRRAYTGARLNTQGKVEVQPGSYVEAEIRATTTVGVRPAFWLLGSNWQQVGWPAAGELDVMEGARHNASMIRQTMHMSRLSKPKEDAPYGINEAKGETTLGQPRDQGYHRYGVYFDEHVVQFYVDRKPTLRFTSQDAQERDRAWPFDRPMFLLLSVAVLGEVDNAGFPAAMSVQRIAIWGQGVPF